jgi:branched-subunit amino acid aminotransferase/4-amino-4-deoxychorismate lyase
MSSVWLNGEFLDEAAAAVSIRDTGLLHGAGVFTTMRAYGGRVFQLHRHLRRLRDSCEALFVPLQCKDDVLAGAAGELLRRNELSDARLRLTVTRGAARQDPLHGLRLEPNVFLTAAELEPYPAEYYERGLTVVLLDEQKLNPYDLAAGHKTLNYFSRLAALREANRRGAGEALWFSVHNYLESGSITNVFVVKDGRVTTPPTPADLHDSAVASNVPPEKRGAAGRNAGGGAGAGKGTRDRGGAGGHQRQRVARRGRAVPDEQRDGRHAGLPDRAQGNRQRQTRAGDAQTGRAIRGAGREVGLGRPAAEWNLHPLLP